MSRAKMKAIRLHEFGGPEVLRYEDAPIPELKPGEVLVRVHAVGINPPDWYLRDGYEALKKWEPIEYVAGYRARLAAIPVPENAHHCWQCGCEDAATEALELARHKCVIAEGREDDYTNTWGLLFDAGGDARSNGISFDETRTQPWKEGWVAADINLGTGFEK